MRLADRLDRISPFFVMEVAKAAADIARGPLCDPAQGGRPMIALNIGEPDFGVPPAVAQAAAVAIRAGQGAYTDALGLPALRGAISRWYAQRHGLDVPPSRIVVTAGASAGLQLVTLALFQPGDAVLMSDPGYPCNRHFVAATGADAVLLPCGAQARFQPTAAQIEAAWTPATRGVLLATPSNPTGTSIAPAQLQRIVQAVRMRGGVTLVDEIYLPLSHDPAFEASALALGEDVVSINSFSKYFGMTGWRLGWLVLPEALVAPVERLAQNLYICPSAIAQRAALACFEPDTIAVAEQRRGEFKRRRDFIVPALDALDLPVPVPPDGAFYAWADCSAWGDSWTLAFDLLRRAQVALAPGRDFGPTCGDRFLRLSFASSMPALQEAVRRLQALR